MLTLQSIFTSGWVQILILLAVFWGFSQWALRRGAKSGYVIGWLIGIFIIVAYGALFPYSTIQLSGNESAELGLLAVLASSFIGAFIGILIIGVTFILQRAWFRQTFSIAGITAVFVTMLFAMVISTPPAKVALTLALLAFTIVVSVAYIGRRAYLNQMDDTIDEESDIEISGQSRIDRIRDQVTTADHS